MLAQKRAVGRYNLYLRRKGHTQQNGAIIATICLTESLIERFELLHKFPSHFV